MPGKADTYIILGVFALAIIIFTMMQSSRSHIYHRADCPSYAKVTKGNRISFVSVEAKLTGYRVAGNRP